MPVVVKRNGLDELSLIPGRGLFVLSFELIPLRKAQISHFSDSYE